MRHKNHWAHDMWFEYIKKKIYIYIYIILLYKNSKLEHKYIYIYTHIYTLHINDNNVNFFLRLKVLWWFTLLVLDKI